MPIPKIKRRQTDGWKNQAVNSPSRSNSNGPEKPKKFNKLKALKRLFVLVVVFLVVIFIYVAWL